MTQAFKRATYDTEKEIRKTFRNTKTVQLVLLLLLEAAYVLVLTLNPALGTKLFEDRTLFILCTLSWILALFNLIWLLYDFINYALLPKKAMR